MKPPLQIDGADVVEWSWSEVPFGKVGVTATHGLAICRYKGASEVYRFSWDKLWQTQQDQIYGSVPEAKDALPKQYCGTQAIWHAVS